MFEFGPSLLLLKLSAVQISHIKRILKPQTN